MDEYYDKVCEVFSWFFRKGMVKVEPCAKGWDEEELRKVRSGKER